MAKPVPGPREGADRDGAFARLFRLSFKKRYRPVVTRFLRFHVPVVVAVLVAGQSTLPVVAGNLTLPFASPNPVITSWMDHHYPTRQPDGIMIRFDGATGYPYDGHRGTDYAIPSNTPVVAADDGTVIYAEWSDTGGWGVVIDHALVQTAYFHNNVLFVYPGQHVSHGQLIALSGSTGNSTGPHVHFEVRDLLTPWHSIDPYGWTGPGQDPWRWDEGYLWSSSPPVPFLLPLAFLSGARWNYWYGLDGAPPPVSWRVQDGGQGFLGYAVQWDADPGPGAPRTPTAGGSLPLAGPGRHTLHLRVFDGRGTSADVTYLYLYDTGRPTAAFTGSQPEVAGGPVNWTASDDLSGVQTIRIDLAIGGQAFRPWVGATVDQPGAGSIQGGFRLFAEPGLQYRLRLTVANQARATSPSVTQAFTVPAGAPAVPTAADQRILGGLPGVPPESVPAEGLAAEHAAASGDILLSRDGALHGLGTQAPPSPTPDAAPVAVDAAGELRLFADGSTLDATGAAGPHFTVAQPIRLLAAGDGSWLSVGAGGGIMGTAWSASVTPDEASTIQDAALFPGTRAGLALDTAGSLHAFGNVGDLLQGLPDQWTLPADPAGIAVAGSPQAPAGLLLDARGDRQAFGSLLLLPAALFAGPTFDPETGLVVR